MNNINSINSSLIKAYVNFQANPNYLDSGKLNELEEEMGTADEKDATPEQKVDKYIVEQVADISEEVKQQLEEMKKQQEKLLALGQANEANKFQTELDQKNELATRQAQNESSFMEKISKNDLTNVLKQALSDDSGSSDDDNIDLIAALTNMIADKDSTTTIETEA